METQTKEHKLLLGLVDGYGNGKRNCKAYLEWSLEDGRFSMSAAVWQPDGRDTIMGGQCCEEVLKMLAPGYRTAKNKRMVEVWKRWHLNDLKAGSPAQEAFLEDCKDAFPGYPTSYYEWASAKLEAAGLNPDPGHLSNGKPYKYGSAWLTEELPADVRAEIESW